MPEAESSSLRIAFTTAANKAEAERIAHALLESHLAACVNLLENVSSMYRWQGKVEQAMEVMLWIKTDLRHLQAVQQTVSRLHSYELPEFLVLPIAGGSDAYLGWWQQALLP
ncbi:MAG: divalent-cation tolerance protein CutA [Acidobacteriaceae bacterium]